jgi:hypothetical protein
MVRRVHLNQRVGVCVDLSSPEVNAHRFHGRDDWAYNVMRSLYECGFIILKSSLAGVPQNFPFAKEDSQFQKIGLEQWVRDTALMCLTDGDSRSRMRSDIEHIGMCSKFSREFFGVLLPLCDPKLRPTMCRNLEPVLNFLR